MWIRLGGSALTALLLASRALACPSCKDAISGDPVASALSWTTLLLIALPALLMGGIGGWVGYLYWRAEHQPPRLAWPRIWREKESET